MVARLNGCKGRIELQITIRKILNILLEKYLDLQQISIEIFIILLSLILV